jgi:hypothetical protein
VHLELQPWESRSVLRQLEIWLQQRKESGTPLISVCFQSYTPHLWSLFQHLTSSQAATSVSWEGEHITESQLEKWSFETHDGDA